MTGVQAQAEKLLEGFSKLTFKAARQNGKYLDIGQLEVIMMALEKQVPKKPSSIEDDMGYFICARCGGAIYYSDEKETHEFCLMCGQAIDWRKK